MLVYVRVIMLCAVYIFASFGRSKIANPTHAEFSVQLNWLLVNQVR